MNSIKRYPRRSFLAAGAAGLFAGGVAAPSSLGQSTDSDLAYRLSAAGRVIKLIPASDPSFAQEMDGLFPSLLQNPNFQTIAPLSFLVTNESGPAIVALSTTWTIITSTSVMRKPWFSYVRSGPNTLVSGDRPFLSGGKTRLVSPFFSWASSAFKTQPPPDWTAILNRGEFPTFLKLNGQNSAAIKIQIEAAVHSDWTLIGTDEANLSKHLRIRRNAEVTEAFSVLKLVQKGAGDDELIALLKKHQSIEGVAGRVIPRSNVFPYWHFLARTFQAQLLESRLNQVGASKFVNDLMAITGHQKTTIQPLAA